jgi:dTDP-4-dehydrorhamnose 3,5-epimerase
LLKVIPTELHEVLILEYEPKEDARGPVFKNFSKKELERAGILTEFVEEYLYCPAKKGTLYGIHFQNLPKAQGKLVCCTKGRCLDFAVDLRKRSATYRQWVSTELSPENRRQMFIPRGFGHALLTLEDDTHIVFRIDEYFDPELSRAISYKDEELNIPFDVKQPVLSLQDRIAPLLKDSDCNFE